MSINTPVFEKHKRFKKCHKLRHEKEAFLGKIMHAIDTAQKYLKIMSTSVIFLKALAHLTNGQLYRCQVANNTTIDGMPKTEVWWYPVYHVEEPSNIPTCS